jgi:ankyrin repeat protein
MGNTELVKRLLKMDDIDKNLGHSAYGSPLMAAISMGHGKIILALLQSNGIGVNSEDSTGWRPLILAVTENQE